MRVEFLQSIDFNQMLVYSTFVHLFFLTMVMFLPSPRVQETIVVPTFRLDLIELPPVIKPSKLTSTKQKIVKPQAKKRTIFKPKIVAKKQPRQKTKMLKVKPKPKPKPLSKPVLRKPQTNQKVLTALEGLQSSAPEKTILQKLDEVARATNGFRTKKMVRPKPWQDNMFKVIEDKKPMLPSKPDQTKVPPVIYDLEVEAKKRESSNLVKESNQVSSPKRIVAADLIKKLDALGETQTLPSEKMVNRKQLEESNADPVSKNRTGKPLVSVAKKFKALEESSKKYFKTKCNIG